MPQLVEVSWEPGSSFFRLVCDLTARKARCWHAEDPLEALSAVWRGLGRWLDGSKFVDADDRRLPWIVSRAVSSYYHSPGVRPSRQPGQISIDDPGAPNLASGVATPAEEATNREFRELVEREISALAPRRSEAMRLRLGCPGPSDTSTLAQGRTPSRQGVHKHFKNGIAEIRPVIELYVRGPLGD